MCGNKQAGAGWRAHYGISTKNEGRQKYSSAAPHRYEKNHNQLLYRCTGGATVSALPF